MDQKKKLILLSEAAKLSPYSQEYLSLLARRKKIFAQKIGRNWYTNKEAVENHIKNQENLKLFFPGFQKPILIAAESIGLVEQKNKETLIEQFEKLNQLEPFKVIPKPAEQKSELVLIPPESRAVEKIKVEDDGVFEKLDAILEKIATPSEEQLTADQKKFVISASQSSWFKLWKFNLLSRELLRDPKKSMIIMVGAIVLLFLLAGGFSFGQIDNAFQRVKKIITDADTLQGHFPGTHSGEVLLLDKAGNISIYGHIETQGQLRSYAIQGVAPIVVDSITKVENLNVDYFDSLDSTDFTLAFVTKNGNITYEDVFLEGNVEVGKTLLVKGPAKLLNSLAVDGGIGVLSGDVRLKSGNLILDKGTIKIESTELVENLNADRLDYLHAHDFTLDRVVSFGDTAYRMAFFEAGLWGKDAAFGSLGVKGDVTVGNQEDPDDSRFAVFSKRFVIDENGNLTASGKTKTDDLVVSSKVISNLIPSGSYDLGSAVNPWDELMATSASFGNLTVTGTGGGNFEGTTSSSFRINTDNAAADTEDAYLSFERGAKTPNAIIKWDSTNKQFNINQPLKIASTSFELSGTASISGDLTVLGDIAIGTTSTPFQLTVIGSGSFTGQLKATRNPTLAHTGTWPNFTNTADATFYLNPSSPVADGNVIAYVSGSNPKFVVDAEGDTFISGNLTLVGTTTQASTEITGDLTVEGNSTLGDAQTDIIKLSGTIRSRTLTSFPVLVKASASQTVDAFRILDPNDNIFLTLDQGTGLLTASSGFNFAMGTSTATASYSRLGAATTTHSNYISSYNDFLISGDLEVNATAQFDSFLQVGSNTFYANPTTGNVGIGTTSPTSLLTVQGRGEFQGTASASYFLTGNTLQVGGFASAAYSRFGVSTTGHSNYISASNDLLISGDLEVRATGSFGGNASVSGDFLFHGEIMPDGELCSNRQFIKKIGAGNWDCAAGEVSSNSLDFDEFINNMTLDANLRVASAGFAFNLRDTDLTAGNITASSSGNVDFILRSSTTNGASNNDDAKFTIRTGSSSENFQVRNGANDKLLTIASSSGLLSIKGPLTSLSSGLLKLQAGGAGTGSTGSGSIYFLDSSGTTKGRLSTTTADTVAPGAGDGDDGGVTINGGGTKNCQTTAFIAGRSGSGDCVATSISTTSSSGQAIVTVTSTTGFAKDDEVLLIQMTGTGAGNYEFRRIKTVDSATQVTLTADLTNTYTNDGTSKPQMVRVPNYTIVTVTADTTFSVSAWNGTTGGVMPFRARTSVTIDAGSLIDLNALGFVGGSGTNKGTGGNGASGGGLNGVAGIGGSAGDTGDGPTTTTGGGTGGSVGGNPGGLGNGTTNNSPGGGGAGGTGGGGAGGAYATANAGSVGTSGAGGAGGDNASADQANGGAGSAGAGGSAATTYGTAALTTMFLGSGGGQGGGGSGGGGGGATGGSSDGAVGKGGDGGDGGAGGTGGGIIFIETATLTNNGTIRANGAVGSAGVVGAAGATGGTEIKGGGGGGSGGAPGGGGSGGSINIQTDTITEGTITASGGAGSSTGGNGGNGGNPGTGSSIDGGGGGGTGTTGGTKGTRGFANGASAAPGAGATGGNGRIRCDSTAGTGCSTTPAANENVYSGSYGNNLGTLFIGATNTTSADLAEYYPTHDPSIQAGDVVSVKFASGSYGLVKARDPDPPLGIISSNPGLILSGGDRDKTNERMVALAGRVLTKVSTENGPIKVGDRLALSKTDPGIGVKAIHPGQIVGIALDNFGSSVSSSFDIGDTASGSFNESQPQQTIEYGSIMAFVNVSYWAPSEITLLDGANNIIVTSTGIFSDLASTSIATIQAGLTKVQNLWATGDMIAGGIKKTYYSVTSIFNWEFNLAAMVSGWLSREIIISPDADDAAQSLFDGAQVAAESKLDLAENGNYLVTYGVDSARGEIILSGTSKLQYGEAKVFFDFSFTSVISDKAPLKVLVTPVTDTILGQLVVTDKTPFGFVVKELNAKSDGKFDWLVIARRKEYEGDDTAASPTPSPESIPEPSPEPTPEPTPEASPSPSPKPTPESTPEPAPELTPEPTPEAESAPLTESASGSTSSDSEQTPGN